MSASQLPLGVQLEQLEQARKEVLRNASSYPQIVQGILPIISRNAKLEVKQWGAGFLAETFSSPELSNSSKESLALSVLIPLGELFAETDTQILKGAIQCCASVYPLLFKYVYVWIRAAPLTGSVDVSDAESWKVMLTLKKRIFDLWNTTTGVTKACCIKFAQKVVIVQTPAEPQDPRRPDPKEISSLLVPRNHVILSPSVLEAEAMGLLDRLLAELSEPNGDPLAIAATLNCLGPIMRSRPHLAKIILNGVLGFNPLKLANSPMSPVIRLQARSMERTARSLLFNYIKYHRDSVLLPRIQEYLEHAIAMSSTIFDDGRRKRRHPGDIAEAAKRAKLQHADLPPIQPLPPGPVSVAQLFTITDDQGLAGFDVRQLPENMVIKILIPVLQKMDQSLLGRAVDGVRTRYDKLKEQAWPRGVEDEDDYEPDFQPVEDDEQILNKLDVASVDSTRNEPEEYLGKLELSQPRALTNEENRIVSQGIVMRLFALLDTLPEAVPQKQLHSGFNRVAATTHDKMSWLTVIARIATRSTFGLEDQNLIKEEPDEDLDMGSRPDISKLIRDMLYRYIMEDFRHRIDVAIMWLNEEWYNDKLLSRLSEEPSSPQYPIWSLKIVDGILPFLDASDKKILPRFLSEIPEDTPEILEKVKTLCLDPERVGLAIMALQYLTMLKVPARDACLDVLEDLYRNVEDAKASAEKILKKWRPEVLAV